MRTPLIALASVLAVSLSPLPAAAQSEEDLLKRFQAQQTRGLSITPATSAAAATAGAAARAPEAAATAPAPQRSLNLDAGSASAEIQKLYVPDVPDDVAVNIRVNFALNSAEILPSEAAKLQAVCRAIQASDIGLFRIFGHTDASGSASYNLDLSKRRAQSVRGYLIYNCGISPDRLQAYGLGEDFPLRAYNPRAAENRRVEFQVAG